MRPNTITEPNINQAKRQTNPLADKFLRKSIQESESYSKKLKQFALLSSLEIKLFNIIKSTYDYSPTHQCYKRQDTLGDGIDRGPKTVQRYIKKYESMEILETVFRGPNRTLLYIPKEPQDYSLLWKLMSRREEAIYTDFSKNVVRILNDIILLKNLEGVSTTKMRTYPEIGGDDPHENVLTPEIEKIFGSVSQQCHSHPPLL